MNGKRLKEHTFANLTGSFSFIRIACCAPPYANAAERRNRSDAIGNDNLPAQERCSVPSELVVLSATRRTC